MTYYSSKWSAITETNIQLYFVMTQIYVSFFNVVNYNDIL